MDQEDVSEMEVATPASPAPAEASAAGAETSSPTAKKPKGGAKKRAKQLERQRSRLIIALVVAVVAAIALAVTTVVLAFSVRHDDHLNSLRRSAASTAQQYAVEFSTYDYRNLDADFNTILSRMTPSFRADYEKTVPQLKALVVQLKGTASGTVQGVGVTSVSSKTAVVLIFIDQKVSNTNLKTPRVDARRLHMTLQRSKGTWLMSELTLK